jgi:hypothetical protein
MQAHRVTYLISVLVLVFTLAAGPVFAQSEDLPERKVVLSTNPILFVFTWYGLELEFAPSEHTTIGVTGSYFQMDEQTEDDDPLGIEYDDTYIAANAFVRYYPVSSFKGFFIGAKLGLYNITHESEFEKEEGTAYGLGVDIGYGWLLGAEQRISVSIGVGASRLFGGDLDDDDEDDVLVVLPSVRLINVGIAF